MVPPKNRSNSRRTVIIVAVVLVVLILLILLVTQVIIPGLTPPVNTGQPKAPTLSLGANFSDALVLPVKLSSAYSAIPILNVRPIAQAADTSTPASLYQSCTTERGSTATPSSVPAQTTPAATTAVTSEATLTPAATATNLVIYEISGPESQACYLVGETLFNQSNAFRLAIGVSTAIDGQIAIDPNDVSQSQVGQIVVDISQLTSDSFLRDGQIRDNWLESNTYPLAKFTPTQIIGLPRDAYKNGDTLTFQAVGTLNVHNTDHSATFDVSAYLNASGDTLVVTASADVLMTDFGFQPPSLPVLKANDQVHLVLNLVAHPVKKS